MLNYNKNAQDVSDVNSTPYNKQGLTENSKLNCPFCGQELTEYVEECPNCKHHLEKSDLIFKDAKGQNVKPLYGEIGNSVHKEADNLSKPQKINENNYLYS